MTKLFKPSHLGRLVYPWFEVPNHIKLFQDNFLKLYTNNQYNRLIIQLPIRMGKSVFGSTLIPAWTLLTNPNARIILSTYGAEFSEEFTFKVRNIIREYGWITGVELDPNFGARGHFKIKGHDGEMIATSPGGSVAGRGATLIIGDDLVKDVEQANSPTQRAKLNTWFSSELLTRLEPNGKVLVIMSRRHPSDLTGTLLESNNELQPIDQWNTIRLPAIQEDGTALWPERFSLDKLNRIHSELISKGQSYLFSSLYMQSPFGDPTFLEFPDVYFTDIYYPDDLPYERRLRVLALDPSLGKNAKSGDYAALTLLDLTPDGSIYIPHSSMRVMNSELVEDTTIEFIQQYQPDAVIVEANGFQEMIAHNIMKKASRNGLTAPVHLWTNTENKEVRIRTSLTPLLAQHKLKLRKTRDNTIIYNQMREFPIASHDDGLDSIDLGIRLLSKLLSGKQSTHGKRIVV